MIEMPLFGRSNRAVKHGSQHWSFYESIERQLMWSGLLMAGDLPWHRVQRLFQYACTSRSMTGESQGLIVDEAFNCFTMKCWEVWNNWLLSRWVSKMITKHKSTVLCCAFHPSNGQLLATGSADFKCRSYSHHFFERSDFNFSLHLLMDVICAVI